MRLKNNIIGKLLDKQPHDSKEEPCRKISSQEDMPETARQAEKNELTTNLSPGAIRGRENEEQVLVALHKFGWLTTRQIGQIVWPDGKSSIAMARRVLARLKDRRFLVYRPLPQQNHAWVLTTEGAKRLHEMGCEDAKRGTDLLRGKKANVWFHRWLANEILIQSRLPFESFSTEYEIQGHRSPLSLYPPHRKSYLGKIPDALFITQTNNGRTYLDWIEVELSRKRISDLKNLIRFMIEAFCDPHIISGKLYLSTIRLFFAHNGTNPETTREACQYIQRITSELRRELRNYENDLHPDTWKEIRSQIFENMVIYLVDIRQGPVFKGITQKAHLDNVLRYQNTRDIKEMLLD